MNDLEFVGDYRQPQLSARQRALGHDGGSAGEFTFGDFLDIINPFQHIPIVSTLYREITGDEISPHARILGDTLFGGPAGFLSSIANVFYEEVAGEDVGETVIAFFDGGDAGEEPQFAEGGEPAGLPAALETAADAPAAAAVVVPDLPPGVLTGEDALAALFMDLRGSRPAEATATPPSQPPGSPAARSYPLPPRPVPVPEAAPAAMTAPVTPDAPEVAAHPLLFAQEEAGGAIAERMMEALDKYRAMARGSEEKKERDEEQVIWESDPAAAGS